MVDCAAASHNGCPVSAASPAASSAAGMATLQSASWIPAQAWLTSTCAEHAKAALLANSGDRCPEQRGREIESADGLGSRTKEI